MTVSQIGGRRTLEFVPVGEQFQEHLRALFPHEANATRALVTPTDAIGVDELPSELVGSYQQQLHPDIQVLLSDDHMSMKVVFRLAAQGLRLWCFSRYLSPQLCSFEYSRSSIENHR